MKKLYFKISNVELSESNNFKCLCLAICLVLKELSWDLVTLNFGDNLNFNTSRPDLLKI